MKAKLLIICMLLSFSSFAQITNIEKERIAPRVTLKLDPTKLAGMFCPGVYVQSEFHLSDNISLEGDAVLYKDFFKTSVVSPQTTKSFIGYGVGGGFKAYAFNKKVHTEYNPNKTFTAFFFNLRALYSNAKRDVSWVAYDGKQSFYKDNFTIHTIDTKFEMKLGLNFRRNRITTDFFAGLGLRIFNTVHTNRAHPEHRLANYDYFQLFTIQENDGVRISIPFGLTIGYQIR